jgi:hypothetical protein
MSNSAIIDAWRLGSTGPVIRFGRLWALVVVVTGCSGDRPSSDRDIFACPACTLALDTLAVLGNSEGPGALTAVIGVRLDSQSRYWVFGEGAVPQLFGPDGEFMLELGRLGEGPGEFVGAHDVWMLPGDSLLVRDGRGMHVFAPELTYVRSVAPPLLGIRDGVVLSWPDMIVVNALHPSPPHFGHPLHIVDLSERGQVVRSFGGDSEPITQSMMYTRLPRTFARSPGGGYWAAAVDLYDVHKWSDTHDLEFTISRRPEWFAERSSLSEGSRHNPPPPRCLGVTEDSAGSLWSFCLAAAPDWQLAYEGHSDLPAAGGGYAEGPGAFVDRHRLYRTQVDVFETRTRALLWSTVADGMVISVLPGPRLAIEGFRPDGTPTVVIVQPRLVREAN